MRIGWATKNVILIATIITLSMTALLLVHLNHLAKDTELSVQVIQSTISESYKGVIRNNGELLSGYLKKELTDPVSRLDYGHINIVVEHLRTSEIIDQAVIFDRSGDIIHDGTVENFNMGKHFANTAVLSRAIQGEKYQYFGSDSLNMSFPIVIDDEVIAGVFMSMPLSNVNQEATLLNNEIVSQLEEQRQIHTKQSIVYFVITVLFSSICVFILSRKLISPIYRLTQHIGSMREGEYKPLKIKQRDDEVGVMINKFNGLCYQLKRHDQKLSEIAYYDALTFLPNRRLLKKTVNSSNTGQYYVLFMDLDGFKSINDNYGHQIGDEVLKVVASRIRSSLRLSDRLLSPEVKNMAARVGGDEFVIYLDDSLNKCDVEAVANRLISTIKEPIAIDEYELYVNTSIGVFHGLEATAIEQSIKNADIALYEAKRRGKGRFVHFDSNMEKALHHRYLLENKLQSSLKTLTGYYLEFQPQFKLADYEMAGVEVLLRWHDDEFGDIESAELVKICEELNILHELTRWQISELIKFYDKVRGYVSDDFYFSMNIGTKQVVEHPRVDRALRYLSSQDIRPSLFRVEIPEASFVHDADDVKAVINTLKLSGIDVWLDNVGASQTSLKLVSELKLSGFKIDRTFFTQPSQENELIVSALISIASKMGIGVIANGVESEESEAFLKSEGCLVAQGHYFAKPMSQPHLEHLLKCFSAKDHQTCLEAEKHRTQKVKSAM